MKLSMAVAAGTLLLMACGAVTAQTPTSPATAPAVTPAAEIRSPYTPAQLAKRGVQRFMFADWGGPALPVWYYRPAGTAADAPVLFVFHGVRRDADRYLGEWLDVARKEGLVIIVPEFNTDSFPGARGYNHGNLIDARGSAVPVAQRSFALIEPLFDAVRAREQLTRKSYWMFGHSAGAQYVHRFVMTGNGTRMERAVSANAGSYMYPDARFSWPFGTKGLPDGIWNPAAAYASRMTILLGTSDNDPNYPSLPRDPDAMAQGPHRLARGEAFFAAVRADAARRGLNLAWSCALAPGIGHDNRAMAPFGIAVLKGQGAAKPCRDPG